MIKRALNILLAIILVFSISGVNRTRVYCKGMDKVLAKACCEKPAKDDCCKKIVVYNHLDAEFTVLDNAASLQFSFIAPSITLWKYPFTATLEKARAYPAYDIPIPEKDRNILFSVFRV